MCDDESENKAANTNQLLFCGLILEDDKFTPFYQTYFVRAGDMGTAITKMLEVSKSTGLAKPSVVECDPWFFDNGDEEGIEIEKSVSTSGFFQTGRAYFDESDTFKLHTGVVCSKEHEESLDVADMVEGYTKEIEECGLCFIEINVDADKLLDLYSKILHLYEQYRVFWYTLHDHWDDESDDKLLANTDFNTPLTILSHLKEHRQNSIDNGFVSLTAFLEEGETNFRISDHKRIIISTFSEKVTGQVERLLEFNRYVQNNDSPSIDELMHHWHYCLPGCLGKNELELQLESLGFLLWHPDTKDLP